MYRFLKLEQIIINKNYIQNIQINKDKYVIHLMANKMDQFLICGSGGFTASNTEFEVCKNKKLSDYKIVTDWISTF